MNKRGISSVVATVLIIFGAVVLSTILFFGVKTLISGLNEINTDVDLQIITSDGYTLWDEENRLATIQVKRGDDNSDLTGFDMVFTFAGDSVKHYVTDIPGTNSKKVYAISFFEFTGSLDSVKIIPVFSDGSLGSVAAELDITEFYDQNILDLIDEGKLDEEDFVEPSGLSGAGSSSSSGGSSSSSSSTDESTDGISVCGDGVVNGSETCDILGDLFGSRTCESEGALAGVLGCNSDCSLDLTSCIYNCQTCASCDEIYDPCTYYECHTQCQSGECYYRGYSAIMDDCVPLLEVCGDEVENCTDYSEEECPGDPCEFGGCYFDEGENECRSGVCEDTCDSLGYSCGAYMICGELTYCGSCDSGDLMVLDFTGDSYIDEDTVVDMTCDSTGCSPSIDIRSIDQDIVALWELEDESDETGTYDLTTNGDVSIVQNCVYGSCFSFPGELGSYSGTSGGPFVNRVDEETGFTISFWIYPRELSGYVFSSFYSSRVYFNSAGLRYTIEGQYSSPSITLDSTTTSNLQNKWTHLVYRYNEETKMLSVFVNGEFYSSINADFGNYKHDFAQDLNLGAPANLSDGTMFFDGMIDEFIVYEGSLEDEVISEIYSAAVPPVISPAEFTTNNIALPEEIEYFNGTVENSDDFFIQFSTDGGSKWCTFTDGKLTNRSTYCYFPTDEIMFKVRPRANTKIEDISIQTYTEVYHPGKGQFPISMNLAGLSYWSTQIVFADAMKRATQWIATEYPWWTESNLGIEVNYTGVFDEQGYPKYAPMQLYDDSGNDLGEQTFETFLYLHAGGNYLAGEYVLLFDGEGTIQLLSDASGTISSDGLSETRYPFTVSNPSGGGMALKIVESNVDNPIKNIRVIIPGHEDTYEENPFYDRFLEMFDYYNGFRFMDLMNTNAQNLVSWDNVRPVDYYTQTGQYPIYIDRETGLENSPGVSPEYLIDLANRAGVNPWFCVPHDADDTYVGNLSQMIHEDLDPSLTVYIEYSNELWNWMFDQFHDTAAKGVALNLDSESYTALKKYAAKRYSEIFKIFEDEYGADSDRLINVVAGQSAGSSFASDILEYMEDETLNPYGMKAEAVAIAPYFNIDNNDVVALEDSVSDVTFKQVAELCLEYIYQSNEAHIAAHRALADQYGADLVTYEGGQHLGYDLDPSDDVESALIELYTSMNRDETIAILTEELFDAWARQDGDMFSYFSSIGAYGRYGSWGAYESMFEGETAKSTMLREWTDAY